MMIKSENGAQGTEKKITVKKVIAFIGAFLLGYVTSVAIQVIL